MGHEGPHCSCFLPVMVGKQRGNHPQVSLCDLSRYTPPLSFALSEGTGKRFLSRLHWAGVAGQMGKAVL